VTHPSSARHDADDARLLNMVRAGDSEAFAALQSRHETAARRLARHLVASPYEVDDVVAEAFAWVLDVTQRGGGPSNAVRPYVLTVLRRVCYYRLTGQPTWKRSDDRALPEPGEPFVEPSMAGIESALVARAYLSLPERWRAVLWHAQVEQARPADVAPLLGVTRNGVVALNRRATDGLRQAYLQRHLATNVMPECRLVGERLDHFVRDPNATADASMVSAHLDTCGDCQAVYSELADVSGTLRAVVGPLILGSAAEAYLFGPGDSSTAASASNGRHVAQTAVIGSQAAAGGLLAGGRAATSAMRALRGPMRRPRPSRALAAAAAVAVVAAIGLTIALMGGGSTPTSAHGPTRQAVATVPPVSPTGQLTPSPGASPAASPSPATSSPAPAPSPAPSPAPPPVTTGLAASLNVSGEFGGGEALQFQVTNTGSVPTGTVTVSITLPAGSSASGRGGGGGGGGGGGHGESTSATAFGGGWSCQPTSGGATCTHAAIAAGQQAEGILFVSLNGSTACGQPASLTATSGTETAQASQDLTC
jgi:DNA-directed RNA polymerase specialized sigma24 family protein